MHIKLLGDLLLIKRTDAPRKVGSIELAQSAIEELQEGEVVAVGPGKQCKSRTGPWVRPMSVKVGDHVYFSKHGHQVVKIDGEPYLTLREDSVVGVGTNGQGFDNV
jgi:chaperonin GroES